MGPHSYQVEVLHFLNPHLIWLEVVNNREEINFEQIGVYGVIPLDTFVDISGNLQSKRCEKWVPAATVVMEKAMANAVEIWFSPTYIDRRSSIFDDNVHKYGDLIIKKTNGKQKYLSKQLTKSGFAMFDVGLFHEELGKGNIKTKLSSNQTREVIKQLESYYKKTENPKKQWAKSVKKHTSLFHTGEQLEALTIKNLKRHNCNRENLDLLDNKLRDLAMCKGVDELPIGRATTKENSNKTFETSSALLKKKLKLSKHKSKEPNNDPAQVLFALKRYSDQNGRKLERSNECGEYFDHSLPEDKVLRKIEIEEISKTIGSFPVDNKRRNQEEVIKINWKSSSKSFEVNAVEPIQLLEDENEKPDAPKNKTEMTQRAQKLQPLSRVSVHDLNANIRVAYGPPDFDRSKLPVKVLPINAEEDVEATPHREEEEMAPDNNMFAEVDSEVDIEIANLGILNENLKSKHHLSPEISVANTHSIVLESPLPTESRIKKTSLLLQRKLKLHKEKHLAKLDSSFTSSSDTTNKDSSLDEFIPTNKRVKVNVSSDDESISGVILKLDLDVKSPKKKIERIVPVTVPADININVNPFKNLDGSKSVFVDKLVIPILMVHTKKNNKIQPCTNLRDIPFSTDVQVVLKNMLIKEPTRLQSVSWKTIMRGYSTFMISPLASGKTIGYLPAVCHLVTDSLAEISHSVGPSSIIVCATAKSVSEIENISKMFLGLNERVLACYSGMDELYLTTSLLNGCDLLICTPSILARLLQSEFGIDLRRLTTFVLDDCERLSEVYANEIKYVIYEIRQMLKSRANKELKVQIVAASRKWCDFMESLAIKAPDSVICIGAFQECVLYSKTHTTIDFVKNDNKINSVIDFIKQIDGSKKTVIVCRSDEEVKNLENALKNLKRVVFACNNTMTVHDLYNLNISWGDFQEPTMGPILVCCDGNLTHLNVTDAHHLLHYSLPQNFSMFCKRFAVLIENYASIFEADRANVEIKVLLEESNVEQLPKILNFVKRCTDNVPDTLDKISENVLYQKEFTKAKTLVPICDKLLTLGQCPDLWNCQERHAIFEEFDDPKEWLPKDGVITFKILHYHTAALYSARLLSNVVKGQTKKYHQTYSTLPLKMGMYYSKESNKKLHGIPKVGDICAVSVKLNFFSRCQVVKILNCYQSGNPNYVLIKLIDEERLERSRDVYLYHLPDELKEIETHVAQVRLANIQPQDKDITFSELAKDQLKKITDKDEDLYMRGQVVLRVGNCVFVETLEACQDLSSLNETVVKHNFKQELLGAHAKHNPEHITTLRKLCNSSEVIKKQGVEDVMKSSKPVKVLPEGRWTHLENDDISSVYLQNVENLDKFFVRLVKFKNCMNLLIKDINKYVSENPETVHEMNTGDIVLAEFPDDTTYERARIDDIYDNDKVKCFFVDQGEWRDVPTNHLVPIIEKFITQIPFQAIECRLIGIKPPGDDWSEFSINWFCDNCYEDNTGSNKHLYVKYFSKDKAEFTGGHKYGVAIIDTNSHKDVIVNQLMIDLNLAREDEEEFRYLNDVNVRDGTHKLDDVVIGNDCETESDTNCEGNKCNVPLENLFLKNPIRSVPLVNSDNDFFNIERWEMVQGIRPTLKVMTCDTKDKGKDEKKSESVAILNNSKDSKTPGDDLAILPVHNKAPSSLDSDDLTSPGSSQLSVKPKQPLIIIDELRKPKLCWCQTIDSVSIKIQLIGVENYDLDIKQRHLKFSTVLNDTKYGFDFELYGVVYSKNCSHSNKGLYILVKLTKVMQRNWLTLTRDSDITNYKWIVYDKDCIDTSSGEEDVQNEFLVKAIKSIHENVESESEDEFIDDANFKYNK